MTNFNQPTADVTSLEAYADSIMAMAEAITDPEASRVFLKLAHIASFDKAGDFYGRGAKCGINTDEGFRDRFLQELRTKKGAAKRVTHPLDGFGGETAREIAQRGWETAFWHYAKPIYNIAMGMTGCSVGGFDVAGFRAKAAWAADGIEAIKQEYERCADLIGPPTECLRVYLSHLQ